MTPRCIAKFGAVSIVAAMAGGCLAVSSVEPFDGGGASGAPTGSTDSTSTGSSGRQEAQSGGVASNTSGQAASSGASGSFGSGAGSASSAAGSSSAGAVSASGEAAGSGSGASGSTATSSGVSDGGNTSGSGVTYESGSASAGSTSLPADCTWGSAWNGNGSFTWYYFGQGTYRTGNGYKTACGYAGTESSGGGQSAVDTVSNVASTSLAKATYFAAIPGTSPSQFDTVADCGSCVEITGMNGNKIVATIVDECPTDSNPLCTTGHLDLSTQAFDALGYSVGDPSGTTWKFVPCPVTGNIVAVQNAANQYYLQNSVYPITSVNGRGPSNYGYFNVSPGNVSIASSVVGQTIAANIPGGGGDTGAQFPSAAGCP
jgi:expansin (peptidoglycan-binding protein)